MANISIGDISSVITSELAKYTVKVAEGVKAAADVSAKEMLDNIRNDAPKRKKKYVKSMTLKTAYESTYEKRIVWYVKSPEYRKSHLLEKGHAKRGGGRVQAYPHISKNEETAKQTFAEKVKKVIQNGGN